MTIITIKGYSVYVGRKCIEDEARTKDDAYELAVNVEASLVAAGKKACITFASEVTS